LTIPETQSSEMLLLAELRRSLEKLADPVKALQMQAYMKSAMPYHGVPMPLLSKTCRDLFRTISFQDAMHWQTLVLELWRNAQCREERYAALYLARDRRAKSFQTFETLKMYEEMIVTGAWWDYVDGIASHSIGPMLRAYPVAMKKKMLQWSRSKNMWKRRAAILCQLGFKADTDLQLLYACIEPSLGSKEFFLQKAIGWALRQYAWIDRDEVARYLAHNTERLSALSRREALKNIA
jgi:3-methyladenine DNA glycosylase AlkD